MREMQQYDQVRCLDLIRFREPQEASFSAHAAPSARDRMMLARIERAAGGVDLRTFECPRRHYTFTIAIEDPIRSLFADFLV
jgi:hypothetical protein